MFDILTDYSSKDNWEEVEQETKRRIILSLSEEDNQFISELCNNTGRANSTVSDHLKELNDMSVVHHPKNKAGYKIISDNVKLARESEKYMSDLIYYIFPILLYVSSVVYSVLYRPTWGFPISIGFIISFSPLFGRKLYYILYEEDYLKVYHRVNNIDTDLDHNFS